MDAEFNDIQRSWGCDEALLFGHRYRFVSEIDYAGGDDSQYARIVICKLSNAATGLSLSQAPRHVYVTKSEWLVGVRQLVSQRQHGSPNLRPAAEATDFSQVTAHSPASQKLALFRSLFRGREDVFARKWMNVKKGTKGFSPACANKWQSGCLLRQRGSGGCGACRRRRFETLIDQVLLAHFTQPQDNLSNIIGVYPMDERNETWFLAIDFDKGDWQKEVSCIRQVCDSRDVPCAVERSQSGNGAHLWIFFDEPVSGVTARRFGETLLTFGMERGGIRRFATYDRLFPNQDAIPSGGFGNLIALPLQKQARDHDNSVFVNESFSSYEDQWKFLASVQRVSMARVQEIIALKQHGSLGELAGGQGAVAGDSNSARFDASNDAQHDAIGTSPVVADNAPSVISITRSNMLLVSKEGLPANLVNEIRRLAAFANPDFYRAQAMRQPVWGKPRIVDLSEESDEVVLLPRGCEDALVALLSEHSIEPQFNDERTVGRHIRVSFTGRLRRRQSEAEKAMLRYDNGVLVAPTGFGKTVIAAAMIARRKVPTLVVVRSAALLQLKGERKVKALVRQYGMVLFDECHHVAAAGHEAIARAVNAKYVYGLTGTPKREDGLQPIIFMQCGPVRHTVNVSEQMAGQRFVRRLVPRFTAFHADLGSSALLQDYLAAVCDSESRNRMIVDDIMACVNAGRTPLVLTKRVKHAKHLSVMLEQQGCGAVHLLTGQTSGVATKAAAMAKIKTVVDDEPLIVVATSSYVGEGFDLPRLDTLFLASPLSWEGPVSQAVGRLHRDAEGKREARVYDYVDLAVPMLERMYRKRLKSYAKLGYEFSRDSSSRLSVRESHVGVDGGLPMMVFADGYDALLRDDINACQTTLKIASTMVSVSALKPLETALSSAVNRGVEVQVFVQVRENASAAMRHRVASVCARLSYWGCRVRQVAWCVDMAVFDGRLAWYGSLPLLGCGTRNADDCDMRMCDQALASLLESNLQQGTKPLC